MTDFEFPAVTDAALSDFAAVAEDYCREIEGHASTPARDFARRVHRLLPELYGLGLKLPSTDLLFADETLLGASQSDGLDPDRIAKDEWQALFQSLGAKLGAANWYRQVFDPYEPIDGNPEVLASLADDLVDTYHDILCGLRKWRRGDSGGALWEWRFGLENHWGEHATGALYALHCRAWIYEAGWPDTLGIIQPEDEAP